MRKLVFLLVVLSYTMGQTQYNASAPWMKDVIRKQKSNGRSSPTLKEMETAFDSYWKTHDKDEKGSGYKPFMRWKEFYKKSTLPDGTLPTPAFVRKAWEEKMTMSIAKNSSNSSWEPLGPFDHNQSNSWSPGQGRVNVVIIDPNDANVMYVGAPAGGIWKSINGGDTWVPLLDDYPQIGVSGIAIDPNNSNIIYIATGDDDHGDNYGIGVLKSIDGGATWTNTMDGLLGGFYTFNDIYIDPTNSDVLWVASTRGVFKTTNAGGSWKQVLFGDIKDIKLKPGNSNIIYAATNHVFYKSTNGGENFNLVSSGLPTTNNGRIVLEVTPAAPDNVYVLIANPHINRYSFKGLYVSTNSGANFSRKAETFNILESTQAWYDLALSVSDTDPNVIFVGCLNIWKSTDGGDDFAKINNWSSPRQATYTHADIHFLRYYNGVLLCGSDGGVYRSTNDGASFDDLTSGLQIGQFYKIAVSTNSTSGHIAGGLQDNGGYGFNEGEWYNYHGADGMDCAIDINNPDHYYGFIQNGLHLYQTRNKGKYGSYVTSGPERGNWVTPLVLDNSGDLIAGYRSVYKFTNNRFVKLSTMVFEELIDLLEIDPKDDRFMYAGVNKDLYRSEDYGVTWTIVETFRNDITSIEVNNDNSNIVYVAISGSVNGGVFESSNKGDTFQDITGNLPPESKFIIKHQKGSASIYLGTYLGVYHKNGNTEWSDYSNGLPNAPVQDLEINLNDQVLVAGTYGRGIWQTPLVASQHLLDFEVPAAPLGLTTTNITSNSVALVWEVAEDNEEVVSYDVYLGDDIVKTVQENSALIEGLFANSEYTFSVRTKDASGNLSLKSDAIKVRTEEYVDIVNPDKPTGLVANSITATSFVINWPYSRDNIGVVGYEAYLDDVFVKNIPLTRVLTFFQEDLTPATTYNIRIRARDAAGNFSEFSDPLQVTTLSEDNTDTEAPTIPMFVDAAFLTENSVLLSWQSSNDNVEVLDYLVYINGQLSKITQNPNQFINGLTPGTDYVFRIRARDTSYNLSGWSQEVSVRTLGGDDTEAPTVPTLLNISALTNNSMTLSWQESSDNKKVYLYEVYVDGQYFGFNTNPNISITGLETDTVYNLKVRAQDTAGNFSIFSETITVRTSPLPELDCLSCDAEVNPSENITTNSEFKIFPNPLKGNLLRFNLKLGEEVSFIIYDITGKAVQQGILVTNYIPVQQLQKGMYILDIIDVNKRYSKYFLKE